MSRLVVVLFVLAAVLAGRRSEARSTPPTLEELVGRPHAGRIDDLVGSLASDDPGVRLAAARDLDARLEEAYRSARQYLEEVAKSLLKLPPDGARVSRPKEPEMPILRPAALKTVVPGLVRALGDDHVQVRTIAARVLAHVAADAKPAVPALMGMLRADERSERYAAARALGAIGQGSAAVMLSLKEALADRDPDVREAALTALYLMYPAAEVALPAAIEGLDDKDDSVRLTAVVMLDVLGPEAAAAVPALIKRLKDKNQFLRERAINALGNIGPDAAPAVPALLKELRMVDSFAREEAIRALGKIGPKAKAALPALEDLLHDEDEGVRRAAAVALVGIGADDGTLLKGLIEKLGTTTVPELLDLMHDLGGIGERARPAVPALRRLLQHPDEVVRRRAVDVLGAIAWDAEDNAE